MDNIIMSETYNNVSYYIRVYDNFLDDSTCESVVEDIENVNWVKHCYTDYDNNHTYLNKEDEPSTYVGPSKLEKLLIDKFWQGYKRYFDDLNLSWYNSWNGFSPIRFNKYEQNQLMSLHVDHINSLFADKRGLPAMTSICLLNDDFTGGDLKILNKKMPLKKGSLILFPSNFMFPHEITKIENGIRYSMLTWAW